MEEMETFYRRMAQSRRCAIRCGGDGGFVPHTKGPVKTDKKISLSVDEKQPPSEIFLSQVALSRGRTSLDSAIVVCVAEWTHTLASERAHTTNDYGKRRYT